MNEPNFEAAGITVILGTSRPNSYTSKALLPIIDELKINNVPFDLIDPSKLGLLWLELMVMRETRSKSRISVR